MRWFKHLSYASDDPTIAMLMDEFGAEGYGVYWIILEKIARNLDENDQTFVTFSLRNWSNFAKVSPKKFQKIANFLANPENFSSKNPLFFLELFQKNGQNYLTIKCPKLLKYRDEYTKKKQKNSGQTPDNVRTNSGENPETLRTNSGRFDIYHQNTDTDTENRIKNIFISHHHNSDNSNIKSRIQRAKFLIDEFERHSGKLLNLNNSNTVSAIIKITDYDDDDIKKALEISFQRKAKTLKYILRVLQNMNTDIPEAMYDASDKW